MSKKVTIGKIAEALNLSRQTIRNYEEYGILDAGRNNENMYREYDTVDTKYLFQTKLYKSMGFTLEEISALLYSSGEDDIRNEIKKHIALCRREKQRLDEIIEELTLYQNDIDLCRSRLGTCWIEDGYKSFYLVLKSASGNEILTKTDQNVIASQDLAPHVRQGFCLSRTGEGGAARFHYGAWIEDRYMLASMLDTLKPVHIHGPGPWAACVLDETAFADNGAPVFRCFERFLSEQRLRPGGDIYGRAVLVTGGESGRELYRFFTQISRK